MNETTPETLGHWPGALVTSCFTLSAILLSLIVGYQFLESANVAFVLCTAVALGSMPLVIWLLARRSRFLSGQAGAGRFRFWFIIAGWSVYSVWLLIFAHVCQAF